MRRPPGQAKWSLRAPMPGCSAEPLRHDLGRQLSQRCCVRRTPGRPASDTLAGVERARAGWSDERLDDLARRMEDGFNRVDGDLRSLRTDVSEDLRSLRTEIGELRSEMSIRIDALQRTMVQLGGGMIAAFLAGFLGLIAVQL